jgi:ADP-ribose pyrophosphatase
MSQYPAKPEVAVGAVVIRNEKILLVKRKLDPAKGDWAIPGGKINLGESLTQAAEREIREETGISIKAKKPIYCFDSIHVDEKGEIKFHYVIVDLMADYVSGEIKPGDDAADVRWFSMDNLETIKLNRSTAELLSIIFKESSKIKMLNND